MLNHSLKVGFSFGLTSGIITTIGLMVGLYSTLQDVANLKLAIIGGILTIAIADSLSDAMGIHISEESENAHTDKEVWESTIATFASKFVFALSFIIPVLLFRELSTAVIVSVIWGLSLLCVLSFFIAHGQKKKPWKAVIEHLLIASVVIVVTYLVGNWISVTFC